MEKTIVVLIGNPRGGEKAWSTMYKNLLKPYKADLAVCFGYNKDKSSSLYSKSKYVWEIPEYDNWEDYYTQNLHDSDWWKKSFELGSETGFSGLFGTIGSSGIACAFLHYLLNYKKNILLKYDRIIVTRSDYFYLKEVPILSNDSFWSPTGEEYGGITDRFFIFPSSDIDIVLGMFDNYINTDKLYEDFCNHPQLLNIERSYFNYFQRIDYLKKLKKFCRVQFLVKTKNDPTRWSETNIPVPYNEDLYIKYESEYNECMEKMFTTYLYEC